MSETARHISGHNHFSLNTPINNDDNDSYLRKSTRYESLKQIRGGVGSSIEGTYYPHESSGKGSILG
jgi:hypothetical protein